MNQKKSRREKAFGSAKVTDRLEGRRKVASNQEFATHKIKRCQHAPEGQGNGESWPHTWNQGFKWSFPTLKGGWGKNQQTELLSCILKATPVDGRKCLKARAVLKLPADLVTRSTIANITVEQRPSHVNLRCGSCLGLIKGQTEGKLQNC